MDESPVQDHEKIRSILAPIMQDYLDDPQWRAKVPELQRFYESAEAFSEYAPTPEKRRAVMEALRPQVMNYLGLIRDHTELTRILWPEIAPLLFESKGVRADSHHFRLCSSASVFFTHYPTREKRAEFIARAREGINRWRAGRAQSNEDNYRWLMEYLELDGCFIERAIDESREKAAEATAEKPNRTVWKNRVAKFPHSGRKPGL